MMPLRKGDSPSGLNDKSEKTLRSKEMIIRVLSYDD